MMPTTRAELEQRIRTEVPQWTKVIQAAGIVPADAKKGAGK